METKRNIGVMVWITILCILVLGLGGYIVYDKVLSEKEVKDVGSKDNDIDNNQIKKETDNTNNDQIEKETDNTNNDQIEKETDNTDNDQLECANNNFQVFANNLKGQFSKFTDNKKIYLFVKNAFDNMDGYSISLDKDGGLFVNFNNKELEKKYGGKIADNVLSFYNIKTGNGFWHTLYFINQDSTVGSAYIDAAFYNREVDKIEIKKDIGYKNIITILNGSYTNGYTGVSGPIFIDINGTVFLNQ